MTARLFRVILQVGDLDRAANFYRKVLGESGERVSGGRHYFKCGDTILACFSPDEEGDDDISPRPNPDNVYFAVDDLETYRERVSSAGAFDILTRGSIDRADRSAKGLGGAVLGNGDVGLTTRWVRVGTLRASANAAGREWFSLAATDEPLDISVVGRFGNVDVSRIDFGPPIAVTFRAPTEKPRSRDASRR